MLVSCHSLNNPEYAYGAGNIGYARDAITFVAFTVDNPDDAATLNYRKTSRQFFFYKPNSGVLLQSKLYDTNGGTWGEQQLSKLYRDLVQRTISQAENAVNLWETCTYEKNPFEIFFDEVFGFGGYADWIKCHDERIKLSVRKDCVEDARYTVYNIGVPSLCVNCGEEIDGDRWFCDECDGEHAVCAECGRSVLADCGNWIYDAKGNKIFVCDECLINNYRICEVCGEYHHCDHSTTVWNDNVVCDDCLAEHFDYCEDCCQWLPKDYVTDIGWKVVCNDCLHDNYFRCEECGNWECNSDANWIEKGGKEIAICYDCEHKHEEHTA